MPPKNRIAAPIDRPLSRAYLREFTGWSTAYPPGLSDPTSLQQMENLQINRDGSVRVRPGLRYLSYGSVPEDGVALGTKGDGTPVGAHETFFLNDGSKAYLYAVRELDGTVGFRVLAQTSLGRVVQQLTDVGIDFEVEPSLAELAFTEATRYVKFLQVDNKIFALSDAGESMRLFYVGADKKAKRLSSIIRPNWGYEDKLVVVHPEAAWINSAAPTGTRTNLIPYSSYETSIGVTNRNTTELERSATFARTGTYSAKISSLPTRSNLIPMPLHDVNTTGVGGWLESTNASAPDIDAAKNAMRTFIDVKPAGTWGYVRGPWTPVEAGKSYRLAYDLEGFSGIALAGARVIFFNSANVQVGSHIDYTGSAPTVARRAFSAFTVPAGATKCVIYPAGRRSASTGVAFFTIKNVLVAESSESTAMFTGNSGVDYFWEGAVNNSTSVYHPPRDIVLGHRAALSKEPHTLSIYTRAGTVPRDVVLTPEHAAAAAPVANTVGAWTRLDYTFTPTAADSSAIIDVVVKDVPRGEHHYFDDSLLEASAVLGSYFDGSFADGPGLRYDWTGAAHNSTSTEKTYAGADTVPTAETKTVSTLINTNSTANEYSFGFFYTFANEVGESAASQATIVKTQRPWSAWHWETPNVSGEPSGTETPDPALCADQLVAAIPDEVFTSALDQGAIAWNLYMFTWSNQEPVPVTAVKVGTRELSSTSERGSMGWLAVTPAQSDYGTETTLLPSAANRYNYSAPSRGGQGIVAADRMVLVKDPEAAAVIRWSSNLQGSYTDFTASRGGGYKTLTSGNLYIPACVKLWQNPQSVDTLTILCSGIDGHSTGYYMAPAQVASQSEATNIMGFEETTATPGTVSPYGCEVLNNALYHPLDEHLMKSSASNYNINHKVVTDAIQDSWRGLVDKRWIVSSSFDNRLYYIVNNPEGEPLEENCNGNEIWVYDAQTEGGSWSRWLVQAVSLRKVARGDRVFMSVVRPDGIFYLDEEYPVDDYVTETGDVDNRAIPWMLETNTQGANRAHDAWAHLQQVTLFVGQFSGSMRYGIRSWDLNGKAVEVAKLMHVSYDAEAWTAPAFDVEDHLLVRHDLKEWFFFAESIVDDLDEVQPSTGQLSLVQYRYAPVSVNVGYEYGSIETFEYGRASTNILDPGLTTNGTPQPMIETRRP